MAEPGDMGGITLGTAEIGVREKRFGLWFVSVLAVVLVVLLPITSLEGPWITQIVPFFTGGVIISTLLTAILLLCQFHQNRSTALLVLACGYLGVSALALPHLLAFPEVIIGGGTRFFMGGPQTSGWLWMIYHGGFVGFLAGYAWVRHRWPDWKVPATTIRQWIVIGCGLTLAVSGSLTMLTTVGHDLLPRLLTADESAQWSSICYLLMIAMVAGSGTTAMALWRWTGGRSYFDAWVLVTLVAFTCEVTFSITGQSRFSLGWYFGRIGGLICTGFLLVMFIVETTRLYARLGEAHHGLSTLNRLLERRIDERTRDLQMANQHLGQALAEKDLLLREVYHRVRNNLQVIDSLMLLYGTQACGKCRETILEMRTRSHILGLVHQQLMRSPDLVTFNARDFLSDLCKNLAVLFEETHQGVRLEYFSDDFPLDLDHAIPLGLVINDLVSNAFKHAFPNNQTGTVQVSLVRRDISTVCLSVQDSGDGMSLEALSPTSVGHQIIEALLAQLDATMTISGRSGTVIEIILPLPAGASS